MEMGYENETNTDYFHCLYHSIVVVEQQRGIKEGDGFRYPSQSGGG
jgi:hypothetical protein